MISPAEAAKKHGIDQQLIYRLIYTNRLRVMKRENRWWVKESKVFKLCPERSVIVAQLLEKC